MSAKLAMDVVDAMDVSQRLDHLISGYFKSHIAKRSFLSNDIVTLCANFTGITRHCQYHLIISNTELKKRQHRDKLIKTFLRKDSTQILIPYKEHFGGYNYEKTIINLRIFVYGLDGVGKSNLLMRYVSDVFVGEDYVPSHVGDEWRKWIAIDTIKFYYQIEELDAGIEFQSRNQHLLTQMDCGIFVYDITNRNSFDELQALIDDVQTIWNDQKDDKYKYGVVVGNKCDLSNKRMVTMQEGTELAQRWDNLVFYETSAKEKINVNEVFDALNKLYMFYKVFNDTDYFKNANKKRDCVLL